MKNSKKPKMGNMPKFKGNNMPQMRQLQSEEMVMKSMGKNMGVKGKKK